MAVHKKLQGLHTKVKEQLGHGGAPPEMMRIVDEAFEKHAPEKKSKSKSAKKPAAKVRKKK